ncbi:MAG: hypothetical protein Q8R25_00160 [bacterium]|nr:hypothetical protein [bacterium]
MKRLIHFNANIVTRTSNHHLAGFKRYADFFKIFKSTDAFIDRTGTISIPLHTKSIFSIPPYRVFEKTYEDICNERAVDLLRHAEKSGRTLYVFWSGGIDSTLVLTSLLKYATPLQKKNIIALMSEESIAENPNFYRDHIHGKLRVESSVRFPYILGDEHVLVSGELNDQLFGSELMGTLMERFGNTVPHNPYNRDMFITFFSEKIGDMEAAVWYVDLFEHFMKSAPVSLSTNHDFIWWITFAGKWQEVYMRMISYVASRNAHCITKEYLASHYFAFFNTDDFQLWSMNNLDKKIKDEWRTYKWPAKKIIYNFTKDANYRDNKTKRGSLYNLLYLQTPYHLIDDSMHFHRENDLTQYHNPDNDFA